MPEISADGKTWTIKVKPGIHFADDAAFKGKKRELTAADYVYSWKRLLDPKVLSTSADIFDETVVGVTAAVAAAKKTGRFDYDAPLEGLQAIDRHTIRIKLLHPDYDLLTELTSVATSAVAREVVEAYADPGDRVMANPVGTGPYLLKEWRRGQKITLEANPDFRDEYFPDSSEPADRAIVAQMRGQEAAGDRTRRGQHSRGGQPPPPRVRKTRPRLSRSSGNGLERARRQPASCSPGLPTRASRSCADFAPRSASRTSTWTTPVVGGYTKEKIALRRAIGMAYNTDEETRVVWQGQAEPATQFLPPHVFGFDPARKDLVRYDVAAAKALLDRFGYVDRDGDGWRDLPDGKPFTLVISSQPAGLERQLDELWKKSMTAVGIRVDFNKQKWPDLLKAGRAGQLQMFTLGNIATIDRTATAISACCGGSRRGSRTSRASACPNSTACTSRGCRCRTGPSASSSCARCRISSLCTHRGNTASIATRTSSSIRGCSGTSTTCSIRITGSTTTRPRAARRGEVSDRVAA